MNTILTQLANFREIRERPPVPECVQHFAAVMGHGKDVVESIHLDTSNTNVYITFTWVSRGVEQGEDYTVPLSVLTADDVTKSATLYKLKRELFHCIDELKTAQETVARNEQRIKEIREDIATLKSA